jgi:hypothetical protein
VPYSFDRDPGPPAHPGNLVLRQAVQMKNRVSGLLMETGVNYNNCGFTGWGTSLT